MKASVWQRFFEEQRDGHQKVLFTVTELANVAGVSRTALNVELTRLRRRDVLAKYAHGLYGLPGAVTAETLVPAIDSHAYITGHYALYQHQLVTQVPTRITCFTDRRSPRARQRETPVGRLVFVVVRTAVYAPVVEGGVASPAKRYAITCIWPAVREPGRRAWSRSAICSAFARRTSRMRLARYPIAVQEHVLALVAP